MKFLALTLIFATLTFANPAPFVAPAAAPAPISLREAQPIEVEAASVPRDAAPAPASYPGLDRRDPKKKTPSTGSGNKTEEGAAPRMITPCGALQLGALGLGVMEVARLWG